MAIKKWCLEWEIFGGEDVKTAWSWNTRQFGADLSVADLGPASVATEWLVAGAVGDPFAQGR